MEDDLAVRFFIRVLLEQLGHRVYEASNANEALQVWNSIGSSINLLLTDAIMPGSKTGRQLAEELRHQRPNLGVILMSGYQSGRFDSVGEPEFIGTFLHKPCSIDDLKEAIKQQLDVADSSAIAI